MSAIHLTLLTTLPLPDALSLKAIPFQAGKLHRAVPIVTDRTAAGEVKFRSSYRDRAEMPTSGVFYNFTQADIQRMYDEMCRGDDERTHAKSSNFEKDSAFGYEDFMRSWGKMYR